MTELDIASQFLEAAKTLGIGFGDLLILLTFFIGYKLITSGKLKIGANGLGEKMEAVKQLIHEKAEAEGKRMDKHGEAIVELRGEVKDLSVKVAKLETKVDSIEQYKP